MRSVAAMTKERPLLESPALDGAGFAAKASGSGFRMKSESNEKKVAPEEDDAVPSDKNNDVATKNTVRSSSCAAVRPREDNNEGGEKSGE